MQNMHSLLQYRLNEQQWLVQVPFGTEQTEIPDIIHVTIWERFQGWAETSETEVKNYDQV